MQHLQSARRKSPSLFRSVKLQGMPHVSIYINSNLFISIVVFRFDGEFYHAAGSSTYSRWYTLGMANYLGKALTTGCGDNSECYVKTELMDMNILTWSSGPDFPFTSS